MGGSVPQGALGVQDVIANTSFGVKTSLGRGIWGDTTLPGGHEARRCYNEASACTRCIQGTQQTRGTKVNQSEQ